MTLDTYILYTIRNQSGHSAFINILLSLPLYIILIFFLKRTYDFFEDLEMLNI